MKKFTLLAKFTLAILFIGFHLAGWGQTSSFLGLDGGFEGSATIDNTATGTLLPYANKWSKANTNVTIAGETSTVRSGANSLKVSSSSTSTSRVWSPLVTFSASTTKWVVQYYRRASSTTSTVQNQTYNYRGSTETGNGSYSTVTAANTWEKVTYSPTSFASATQGAAGILAKMATSAGDMYYDDFCLYESSTGVDVTAPNAPTVPVIGSPTTSSLNVSWTAASGGVDGGGYLVVRGLSDPATAPNVNGIYAVNNTIASGMTVVYSGTGTSFTDNSLAAGTTYYYRIYTFDKAYNYSAALSGSGATSSGATPTLVLGSLTSFGSICTGTTAGPNSFTITGTNLTTADVTVSALTGFTYCTTSNGTYTTSLTLSPSSGSLNQTVYVLFSPSAIQSYDGNIAVGGGGASSVNCAASGSGADLAPSLTTTSPATSVTSVSATCGGNVTNEGCHSVTARGICYGSTLNPDINGSITTESGTTGSFTSNLSGLTPNSLYHFRAYATSSAGTSYGSDQTFSTPNLSAPVANAATSVGRNEFTANWDATVGAINYGLDVSLYSNFGLNVLLTENFAGVVNNSIASPGGTDISATLDTYLQTTGWTGSKIYEAGGAIKLGTASALGYIVTKTVDLSANSGDATLSFDLQKYGTDATLIQVFHAPDGSTFTQIGSDITPTSSMVKQTISITGGTANSKVKISAKSAANNRFFLDNITIEQNNPSALLSSYNNLSVSGLAQVVSGLTANTPYYYRVRAINGSAISDNSDVITATTLPIPSTSTYSGTGNWTESANWSDGLPGDITNVTVSGNLTIDDLVECNDMTIDPAGTVTVTPGQGLIINGNFLIQSTSAGTGSFIADASDYDITGTATVERYITGWGDATHGWHLLSSPVSNQSITGSSFVTTGTGNDYDFYAWSEPNNSWVNFKDGVNPTFSSVNNNSTDFQLGKGYLIGYEQSSTKEFAGNLNNANVNITGLSNNSGSNHGWNLLGNPFSSAITWNDGNWALSDITSTAKIWNESGASYDDLAANDIIPAMNGFMVETTGSGSLTIPAASRTHSSTSWYKSNESSIVVIAHDLESNTAQKSAIRINSEATEGYDNNYDSHFLAGFAPKFYSIAGADQLSTNTLPDLSDNRIIEMGFVKNDASSYSIELNLDNLMPNMKVYLTDKKNDITTDLTTVPVYNFTSADGDDPNRFRLHFKDATSVPDPASIDFTAYPNNGSIYVLSTEAGNTVIRITDITGRVIATGNLTNGRYEVNMNGNTGVYLVSQISSKGTASRKVVVK